MGAVDLAESRIAWIASFPKSGNTWVRLLLESLRQGRRPELNSLSGVSGAGSTQWVTGADGLASNLSFSESLAVGRSVAALQRSLDGSYVTVKTHEAFLAEEDGYPRCWQPTGAKVVYVVRDPRAVAVSWAHHLGISHAQAVEAMAIDRPTPLQPHESHPRQHTSSWSINVRSWLDQEVIPVLLLRYEDLLAQPERLVADLAEWLEMKVGPQSITDAIEACSFDHLATAELLDGFREAASVERVFFRRGSASSWREELSVDLQERVVEDHGVIMRRLGYVT